MDQLVDATLQKGLVPPVVRERPGITVGGGFVGQAGETSTFRYGMFDRIVSWCEVVLANDEVCNSSREADLDLLDSMASSHGTLGVVTLLAIDLIEAKPFMELLYQPVSSIDDLLVDIRSVLDQVDFDFIETMMFSRYSGIIVSGRLQTSP